MPAHFLGVLGLIAAAFLLILGLGVTVFALARGDRPLARRAGVATMVFTALYLLGTEVSARLAPSRVLPIGQELSFCGLDCHLHVSIVAVETDEDRIGMVVRARSDAKAAEEFPRELQFRLVGKDGSVLVPFQEGETFIDPLAAGASAVDTVAFVAPFAGAPYSLRVVSRGIAEALLLGPANSRAAGKTTLGLEESPS
jgi:hypothetical protein